MKPLPPVIRMVGGTEWEWDSCESEGVSAWGGRGPWSAAWAREGGFNAEGAEAQREGSSGSGSGSSKGEAIGGAP